MFAPVLSALASTIVLLLVAGASGDPAGQRRPVGDSRVVARYPSPPGFPEGIAVDGRIVYVSGPAQFGHRADSFVHAFDRRDGSLRRAYRIEGQDPNRDHGISGVALDAEGRVYVLDISQGIVRIDPDTGAQELFASAFPDLPPCPSAGPCSPTVGDRPSLANDMAFDEDGTIYVSDSLQATLFRVPASGPLPRTPEIWFQDPRLDTNLGPNGLRLSPRRDRVYFAVTGFGPGAIYTLPKVDRPGAADLAVFHEYPSEGADGIAFGKSGNLYVTLVVTNEVSVLASDGSEVRRFAGPARGADGDLPWDMPANIAFSNPDRALLMTNHALIDGNLFPDRFAVIDVVVDDVADPLARPALP